MFVFGFKRLHKFQLIRDIPTSKIRSMAMGLVEVHSNVSGTDFIKTPFSNLDCVYYQYVIQEYRKHTHRDSKGRTSTTYSWDTIAKGERRVGFYTKDETGEVYVEPRGAEIDARLKKIFYQHRGFFGGIGTIIGLLRDWDQNRRTELNVSSWGLEPINDRTYIGITNVGDRKFYEYYLEPNERIYILGTAAFAANTPNNVWIKKGHNEPTFMISYKSEKQLLGSLKWQVIGLMSLGSILIVVGAFVALYFTYGI